MKIITQITAATVIAIMCGCTSTPIRETRSMASLHALSPTARYNLISEQLDAVESESNASLLQDESVIDEGQIDVGVDTSKDLPPVVEDIAGIGAIPELQKAAIDQVAGTGSWGFEFIYVDPKGKTTVLSQYNIHQPLIPASTNKLFVGYLSFTNDSFPENSLASMLHVSNNRMSESTLLSIADKIKGNPIETMKKFYSGLDDYSKYFPIDASGLDHGNRVTVRLETSLLKKIYQSPHFSKYKNLLAHPAGAVCQYDTLKFQTKDFDGVIHRYHSTIGRQLPALAGRLYAKTGTLPSIKVKALAGFVDIPTTDGSGVLIFSAIANHAKMSTNQAFAKITSLVQIHTDYVDSNLVK